MRIGGGSTNKWQRPRWIGSFLLLQRFCWPVSQNVPLRQTGHVDENWNSSSQCTAPLHSLLVVHPHDTTFMKEVASKPTSGRCHTNKNQDFTLFFPSCSNLSKHLDDDFTWIFWFHFRLDIWALRRHSNTKWLYLVKKRWISDRSTISSRLSYFRRIPFLSHSFILPFTLSSRRIFKKKMATQLLNIFLPKLKTRNASSTSFLSFCTWTGAAWYIQQYLLHHSMPACLGLLTRLKILKAI